MARLDRIVVHRAQGWRDGGREIKAIPRFWRSLGIIGEVSSAIRD
jgi:hypothetical protein